MQTLHKDWLLLFADTKYLICETLDPDKVIYNDRIIIDDILLYSKHVLTLLHYVSCVAQVSTKYRIYFKLTKYKFMQSRVEFVGHNLAKYENCPAASKFELIENWPHPTHAISLPAVIGLCSFYSRYFPLFETNIKPLRKLQRFFHRIPVAIMA